MVVITGKDCIECKFCTLKNEEDLKNIGVCCSARDNKYYHWGQCLECEFKENKR